MQDIYSYQKDNDPYNERQKIREMQRMRIARISMGLGLLSLVTIPIMPVVLPMILAPVSIMMAVLSRGSGRHYLSNAQVGMVFSVISILINAGMVLITVYVVWRIMGDPSFRGQFDAILSQMYGISAQELLQQYGIVLK